MEYRKLAKESIARSAASRIGKLLRLALGSDRAGEQAAAADALRHELARGGLDLHDLTEAALSGISDSQRADPRRPGPWRPDQPDPSGWRSIAAWLTRHEGLLTERERDFIRNMAMASTASEKQVSWLTGIQQRLLRDGAR